MKQLLHYIDLDAIEHFQGQKGFLSAEWTFLAPTRCCCNPKYPSKCCSCGTGLEAGEACAGSRQLAVEKGNCWNSPFPIIKTLCRILLIGLFLRSISVDIFVISSA